MPSSITPLIALRSLLFTLLQNETLPTLDRWFGDYARQQSWPPSLQRDLWSLLRRAMTRVTLVIEDLPEWGQNPWTAARTSLRGREHEWAAMALAHNPEGTATARAGIASWLESEWNQRQVRSNWSTNQSQTFLASQEMSPPLHVWFRPGDSGHYAEAQWKKRKKVEWNASERAFRLTSNVGIETETEWKTGLVEVQDAASQRVLDPLDIRPSQKVWDVCAGRGGKTIRAAALMGGRGTLFASDTSESKLRGLKQRVKRSGWQNIRIAWWDSRNAPSFGSEGSAVHGYDRVILDVPCSATGTWRRDPEARWRLTRSGLDELIATQKSLLAMGWSKLKSGGRLGYFTCSWLPSENEAVVESFLDGSGARLVTMQMTGLPTYDANSMFVAVLERP